MVRGLSSAGRAVALQASGHRFDPDRLHQFCGLRKCPGDIFPQNSRAQARAAIVSLEMKSSGLPAQAGDMVREGVPL